MQFDLYCYKATVVKVYDGDTITVLIDLGLDTFKKENLRLEDIDAPEVRGEEREAGLVSRDALREKILNKEIVIRTKRDKTGKYGRYIATIFLAEEAYLTETNGDKSVDIEHVNINDWLVENKYAERRIYK